MKIQKTMLALFFMAMSSLAIAQDYKKEIESEFSEYLDAIRNKNFEKTLDYIIPEFFEIIPRAQMLKGMEATFNDPSMEFKIKDTKILSVEDPQKIDERYYSKMVYSTQMDLKIKTEEDYSEEEEQMFLDMTKGYLEQVFGVGNIIFNKETKFYEIQTEKNAYAISDDGKTNWKFLVIEKEQRMLLEKLLPEELHDKI